MSIANPQALHAFEEHALIRCDDDALPDSVLEFYASGGPANLQLSASCIIAMLRGNASDKPQTLDEENSKIQELKDVIGSLNYRQQLYCTDACLRRYLKARNWDVKKAKHMLQETFKWRDSYKPEDLKWEDVSEGFKTGKIYKASFTDKLGRPVIVMTPRLQNSTAELQIREAVYMMENAVFHLPDGQEHFLWIIDFEGWSISKCTPLKAVKETTHILQNHFPERLAVAIILNAPKIFEYTWKLWKPFVDPVTYQKARFVYSNDLSSLKITEEFFGNNVRMDFNGQYNHDVYGLMMQADDSKRKAFWNQEDTSISFLNHVTN